MLYINLKPFEPKRFPDGTQMMLDLKVYTSELRDMGVHTEIYWRYENDEECMRLFYIVNHIKEQDPEARLTLTMPYLPNARMDRTKNVKEVFTLKYFCRFINSLGFNKVRVLDPHSDVGVALLDRVEVLTDALERNLNYAIDNASEDCDDNDFIIFFPDAGAMKRYSGIRCFKRRSMIYGHKVRNWETGDIEGLDIMDRDGQRVKNTHALPFAGKTILMIDDIISYGGTLYHSAKKLKELGAEHIYAYVTHTENSILDPENGTFIKCLDDGTVDTLYTTDSIYNGNHPKIKRLG